MKLYFLVKFLHMLGAIVILGTGTGIAFYMLMAHRSRISGSNRSALVKTAPAIVLMLVALLMLDNR